MDATFWQDIVRSGYAVPEGQSIEQLTTALLPLLGSPDLFLRQQVASVVPVTWMERGLFTPEYLRTLALGLTPNLTSGLGEQGTDSVYLRSYSAVLLSEIVYFDGRSSLPALKHDDVQRILHVALAALEAERDLRGYDLEHGWIHVVAHLADLLFVLASHEQLDGTDLERLLEGVHARITMPIAHVYLYDEEERLVRAVLGVLYRDVLDFSYLSGWLQRLVHPEDHSPWEDLDGMSAASRITTFHSPAESSARHNTRSFLRSLYLQLTYPGLGMLRFVEGSPAVAAALLPEVMAALEAITVWC